MNISTNRTLSVLFWPLIKVCEWLGRNSPVNLVRLRYFAKFKRFPDLDNPRDLNEKILWLKLFSDVSRWIELADKYKVREYMESQGLEKYLVKLYGKWDNVEDIDFSSLPESLIFKANNGDGKGTHRIVRNLSKANKVELKKAMKKWLERKNIGDLSAEPQYKDIPPCIIAEELLPFPENSNSVVDYKIWCINGEPLYIRTYSDRAADGGEANVMTYDVEWNPHPEFNSGRGSYKESDKMPRPKNLEEMISLARTLSTEFPIVRVDLYNIDGKIFFGELTFTSQGGMMTSCTQEFLDILGSKADISMMKKVR